jgi:hypothetical protein
MTSLPGPELWTLLHPHTGDVSTVQPSPRGHSATTFTAETELGPVFVKAVPNRPGGRRDSLIREGAINPAIQPISPAVLWQAENDAWTVLGFEVIHGRPSSFQPGSPDLPTVIDTLNRITALPLPPVAREWTETRWDRFTADEAETTLLRGDTLLYTDINPDNFIIGDHTTWAVDWAWPTRGAALIDPGCLIVQLIAAGHHPADAQAHAERCHAWTTADPTAIDVFAAAKVRMHRAFAERSPDTPWLTAMAAAAQAWADHRHVKVTP